MLGLLAFLYPLAIQYNRGGLWLIVLPITLLALIVDILANLTEANLYFWEKPRPRTEPTFSHRLGRLQYDSGWRGDIARVIIPVLDYFDPSGKHIK